MSDRFVLPPRFSSALALGACLSLGVATSGGCAREQETILIERAIAMEGQCLADPTVVTSLSRGTLDVVYGLGYELALHVTNQAEAVDAGARNSGRDDYEVQIEDAVVELSAPQAPELIDALRAADPALVEFSVELAGSSLGGGGELGVIVPVVSQAATVALRDTAASMGLGSNLTIMADVVVRARRSGNVRGRLGLLESRAFQFPIDLCADCLFTCANCEEGQCPAPGEETELTGFLCGNAQDSAIEPANCAD